MKAVITACILMMGAIVTSCSKDESPDNNVVVAQGDPVNVTVTINQASSGNSRAAGTNEATALPDEIKITDDNLVIFVFDAISGNLESTHAVGIATNSTTGGNTAVSNEFSITTGEKYFYIFANVNSALKHVKTPFFDGETYLRSLAPANSTHDQFRTQTLKDLLIGELSKTENFLIGTLWEGKDTYTANWCEIPVGTTTSAGNPFKIEGLKVGRLVSKVSFPDADFEGQFNEPAVNKLPGSWDKVYWRIVNQPDEMYVIGNWINFIPTNPGSQIVTPFFNSSDLFWDADGVFDKPEINDTPWGKVASRYTLENTHIYPRKGNTTAVQFRGEFTPTTVYRGDNGTSISFTSGTDFYTSNVTDLASVTAVRYYDSDPTTFLGIQKSSNAISDYTKPVRYKKGEVYYLAYITDSNESKENEGRTRYAVLRNHQYKLDIASINSLGDNDDNPFNKGGEDPDDPKPGVTDEDPKPTDPIDKDIPNITISIEVMDWYRIDQSINW